MQFFFMTALLMRWQVIPANFVVFFVIDPIFEIPQDHMLPRVKIIIIIITFLILLLIKTNNSQCVNT